MIKLAAVIILGFALLACGNTPQCPTTTGYQQMSSEPTYQQPTQDGGFGVAEFVAGAAVGSIASNAVSKRNNSKPIKTIPSYKKAVKSGSIKNPSKRKVSLTKPRKSSVKMSSSRSGKR